MFTSNAGSVTLWLAFVAGGASLVSPCVLALLPVYVTYLSGVSASDTDQQRDVRLRVLGNAFLFIAGFTIVFVAFFGLTAVLIGKLLLQNQTLLRQISGIIVIIFGLHTTGILQIPFLLREVRAPIRIPPASPMRSFIIGMAFAAGWTPCVGPILGTIMVVAANSGTAVQGFLQLLSYSIGMAIPFLLIALYLTRLRGALRWMQQNGIWVSRVTGVLLIIVGVMLYNNTFTRLASIFNYWEILP